MTATFPERQPANDRANIIMPSDRERPNRAPDRATPATPQRMTGRRPIRSERLPHPGVRRIRYVSSAGENGGC